MKASVCLTIRDCPEQVHQALKNAAQRNRRSLRQQAIQWLQEKAALPENRPQVKKRVEIERIIREINSVKMKTRLTAEEMDVAKKFGRK